MFILLPSYIYAMKPSELPLGNLVLANGEQNAVTAISGDTIEAGAPSDQSVTDPDFFKPIALNQDWMIKFSGKETGYLIISQLERTTDSSDIVILSTIECYLHDDGFLRVCAYEYDKQPDGSEDISDDVITLGYKHIRYVHQLQNLYFDLTGKELRV